MIAFTSILPPTLISEGSYLRGDLEFQAHVLILGLVEGRLEHKTTEPLRIGRTGWVQGNIDSKGVVVVEGRIDGDIHAAELIRVFSTGVIRGNIHSPRIEVLPGADIEGNIQMKVATRLHLVASY